MKKFTVISLMLVLVASFVFAAGLTPYVNASNSVEFAGVDTNALDEKGNATKPYLTSLVFDGSFVAGVQNAAETVDINAEIDATYDHVKAVDTLTIVPSLNAEYFGENLRADLNVIFSNVKEKADIFGMDSNFGDRKLTVKAAGTYAQNLKASSNILKAGATETLVFDADQVKTASTAEVSFYVPKDGVTPAKTMADKFDSKTKSYVFRGYVNANFGFSATNGSFDAKSTTNGATFGLDFFKYIAGGFVNLNGSFNAAYNAKTTTIYTSKANGEYKFTEVKGANSMDKFIADVKAGLVSVTDKKAATKATTFSASAKVSVPRIIPVELIDSMSFNLPTAFYADYTQYFEGKKETTNIGFDITTYPVYIEFTKNAYTLFDKALESLTVSATYGNEADFAGNIKTNSGKTNHYVFGFGVDFVLDGAELEFAYDYTEQPAGTLDTSAVSLTYTVEY